MGTLYLRATHSAIMANWVLELSLPALVKSFFLPSSLAVGITLTTGKFWTDLVNTLVLNGLKIGSAGRLSWGSAPTVPGLVSSRGLDIEPAPPLSLPGSGNGSKTPGSLGLPGLGSG